MILYTPIHTNPVSPSVGDASGVGAPKDVSATIPLYLERSVTDTFAPQNTSATQSYTVTTTTPSGLLPGFYDPVKREFYQKVGSPSPASQQPVSLVASIQQPTYTQSVTAPASFKTVPYQPAEEAAPAPKPVAPTVVNSAPVVTPLASPKTTIDVSDDLADLAQKVEELMSKPDVKSLIDTYQNDGFRGLFNRSSATHAVKLAFNRSIRNDIRELVVILQRPDVRAAIKDPNRVFGDQKQMEDLQALFDNKDFKGALSRLGLMPSKDQGEAKSTRVTKKKPVIEKAEAASDSDEDDVPAEASSSEAKDIEDFIAEARAAEENEDGEESEAASPVHKHTRRKASAEATED
ncbi:MAG: hypothetical protein QE263_02560 [Vampirovibrionales bacterium]|nr:hypothetical protein [Vampirovibrionales bacterium]